MTNDSSAPLQDSEAATVRDWTDVIRRARLGRTVTAVALMLATYADSDGTRVFPGIARTAISCELGYNAVQDAITDLRAAGLLRLVSRAHGRHGAAEYRLILAANLLDRIEVWTPARVTVEITNMETKKRGRHRKPTLHPAPMGADDVEDDPEPVENSDLHPSARGADTPVDNPPAPIGAGSETRPAPIRTGPLHPAPMATTYHYLDTTTTDHPGRDIRTDASTTANEPEHPENDISPQPDQPPPQRAIGVARVPRPTRCPHGQPLTHRPDLTPRCTLCHRTAVLSEPTGPLATVIPLHPRTA